MSSLVPPVFLGGFFYYGTCCCYSTMTSSIGGYFFIIVSGFIFGSSSIYGCFFFLPSFFSFLGAGCFERLYFFSKFFTQGWSKTLINGKRSVVSYTKILLTRSLYSLERPGLNLIWPRMILSLISLGWTPVKGALPWTSSYRRIPNDHMSRVWLWFLFYIISGAMYSKVPQKVFLYYIWSL